MGIADKLYEGGGAKPVSFPKIGTSYEGTVTNIREKQLTVFGSDTLETWPSGEAKMTPIITLHTSLEEEDGDDGMRDVYFRGGLFTALGQGLREAFDHKPTDPEIIGCRMKVEFHATAPSKYGTPRKLYRVTVQPKASAAGGAWDQPEPPSHEPRTEPDDEIPF